MIQDIYPHKLNNQYHPDQKPDADSIILYFTQYFVVGYSISWMAAIIGALIYGVVDYFIPGNQQM